jgi:hypothetical protein
MSQSKASPAIAVRKRLSLTAVLLLAAILGPPASAQEQSPAPEPRPSITQADATQVDVAQVDAAQGDAAQAQTQNPAPGKAPAADYEWHLAVSPYLWFPGMHGTVGALGHDASVHASAADLLSNFRFGIMGAAEARWQHLLLNGDLMWTRLGDTKAVPFSGLRAVSADVKVGELVWTSKVGARLIDKEKFKADGNFGVRFWHLGQKLSFNPSLLGLDFKGSANWGDPVIGGRLETALSPKAGVTVLGDVGGWGAGSQLDYQFAAALGYKLNPKWTLQAGYRYLFVDYRTREFLYNVVSSGVIFGATVKLK